MALRAQRTASGPKGSVSSPSLLKRSPMRIMRASSTEPDRYSASRTAIMPMRTATSPDAGGNGTGSLPGDSLTLPTVADVPFPSEPDDRSRAARADGQRHESASAACH